MIERERVSDTVWLRRIDALTHDFIVWIKGFSKKTRFILKNLLTL